MCSVRKLAQMGAYFLFRAGGGPMEHVKLMKLMYLADREAMDRYWFPISDDEYYSMKMGPVLSLTLNLMGGNEDPESQGEWGEWVSAKENYRVSLQRGRMTEGGLDGPDGLDGLDELDELADEEIAVLRKVFDEFGGRSMSDLVDHTHGLREWGDPGGGRREITLRSIFEALEKPGAEIETKLSRLAGAKPNTASPRPTSASELISRLDEFHVPPPPYPGAYADKIDAILSAQ